MRSMPMRVAMIASECEPWAKTGGLADVVDALARALGGWTARRSRRRSTSSCRATGACPSPIRARGADVRPARPRSAVAVGQQPGDRHRRRGGRLPAATRRPSVGVRPRGLLRRRRPATTPTTRGGSGCSAGRRSRRCVREGRPLDVLHLHDWHTGPAAIFRDDRYADDPIIGGRGDPHHPAQPRLSRLDAAGRPRSARAGPGDGVVPPGADGLDLLLAGIEGAELVNTVSPGFAAEALTPEFGMGLDGALRAKGDRFFGILNGLDTAVWDPATDADLAAPLFGCGPLGQGGLPRGPADDARVRPRGRRGRDRDDRAARSAEGLRPARRRGADAAGARDPDRRPGQRAGGARGPVPRDALGRTRGRSRFIERFDRLMARKIYAGADFFAMPSRFEPCGRAR